MGRAARAGEGRLNLFRYTRPKSRFIRYWESPFTPGAMLVMTDRIYGVLETGQLFRLPVGTAKHVKAVE